MLSPWSSCKLMKTKFSCETSFKTCQLKLCKGKLSRAHSSKSASWRYENEASVRGSFNICKLKLCNGSFRGDFLQNLQVEDVKTCENEAFVQDFLPKLLFAGDGSLQSLLYCSHCFLAVIFPCGHSLRSFLFPVIVLYSHCALPSLCFAVMVLCSHGSLQCWNRMQQRDQQKDFLSRKYKHETVRGQGCSLVHIQAAAYHRAREDLGSLCANPCVFKFPNSKFQTLFLFLLPILLPIPIT